MDSLPEDFQGEHLNTGGEPQYPVAMSPESVHGTRQAKLSMRTVLRNRMWQIQMLIYRPFLAAVCDHENTIPPQALINGALKCLTYSTSFLLEQPKDVVRHYGSWLLARNAWTAGLSCVAALNEPHLHRYIGKAGFATGERVPSTHDEPASAAPGIIAEHAFPYDQEEVISAVERACYILQQWGPESRSLAGCEWVLRLTMKDSIRAGS